MRIVESHASFIKRCQEDFTNELQKVFSHVERNPMFEPVMALIRVLRVVDSRLKTLEKALVAKEEADAKAQNRFARCETVSEVVAQAVGAGSVSWHGGTGKAVFNSEEATAISLEATERIRELMGE